MKVFSSSGSSALVYNLSSSRRGNIRNIQVSRIEFGWVSIRQDDYEIPSSSATSETIQCDFCCTWSPSRVKQSSWLSISSWGRKPLRKLNGPAWIIILIQTHIRVMRWGISGFPCSHSDSLPTYCVWSHPCNISRDYATAWVQGLSETSNSSVSVTSCENKMR